MKLSDQEAEQYIREKLDRLPPRIAQAVHKLRNAQPAWLKLVAAALLMVGDYCGFCRSWGFGCCRSGSFSWSISFQLPNA